MGKIVSICGERSENDKTEEITFRGKTKLFTEMEVQAIQTKWGNVFKSEDSEDQEDLNYSKENSFVAGGFSDNDGDCDDG